MKFSLFAISAVALCLLQQSQASPLGEGSQGLTKRAAGGLLGPVNGAVSGLGVGGTNSGAVDDGVTDENRTVVDGEGNGPAVIPANGENGIYDLSGQGEGENPTEVKRELLALDDLLGGLLKEVDEILENLPETVGILDFVGINLEGLVGGIVDIVRSLLKENGLVDGLLNLVKSLVEAVIDLLNELGITELDSLVPLKDLLGITSDISKRGATSGIAGGNLKNVDAKVVEDLVKKITDLVSSITSSSKGGALSGVLGGLLRNLLKSVLELVKSLLEVLTDSGVPNTGALRRALIKRAIERRAAL
ncbi:hypothetical protein BJ944DRAFT_272435 [Cunninghamella echinulata]|nr:hypothetical protein BJ944DRAFT_272435 [Cunninghamella echinulata]